MYSSQFLDLVYEAAFMTDQWQRILDRLAAGSNALGSILLANSVNVRNRSVASASLDDLVEQAPKWEAINTRSKLLVTLPDSEFHSDADHFSEQQMAEDWFYRDHLWPLGLGYAAATSIHVPNGDTLIFSVERQRENGPFERGQVDSLTQIRPHLARSAMMASRLAFQQASTMTATLSAVGLPCAVIGENGTVIAMNAEMEALGPRIRTGAGNRVSLAHAPANALLQDILEPMGRGLLPAFQSIPIAATDDEAALVLHLLPIRRNARDVFSRSTAILTATPVGKYGAPDVRVICGLFDLTPGEARVAREIAIGTSIEEIARKTDLSVHTVRTYLKLIYSKTGTSRQAQLTALLAGLATPKT